jgi:hypothetical protein
LAAISWSRPARALWLLAVLVPAMTAAEARWRVALRGLDVTRVAGPIFTGSVLLVDAAALGPSLGLHVRVSGREVTLQAAAGVEWRGTAGDTRLAMTGRFLELERPLRIEGPSVYLPIAAVAELTGLRLVTDPNARTAALLAPSLASGASPSGWQSFTVAKPASPGTPGEAASRRARQDLLLPPDHDTLRLGLGIGAVPGVDSAGELTATGSVRGIETAANALLTSGPMGLDFQSGHVLLTDPERGWGGEAGDLFSEVWGFARGARFRWRRGEPDRASWPALSVYLDDPRAGYTGTVLACSDQIQLGRFTVFGGELASDGSWVVNGQLRRERLNLAGYLRETSGRFEDRGMGLSGSFDLPRGLSLQGALSRGGPRDRPLTGQTWSLRVPLPRSSELSLETSRAKAARLHSRTDALAVGTTLGHVQLRGRYQRRQTGFSLAGSRLRFAQDELFTSFSWRAGRRFRLEAQLAQRWPERGEPDQWRQVNAFFTLSRRTSLQLFASSSTFSSGGLADAFRIRLDRELGPGFSLFAEYGDVVTFQPQALSGEGDGDRSRVRIMVRRSWDVSTPASGSGVEGLLGGDGLPALAGLPVELGPYRTVTDSAGRYSFPHVPPGSYDLLVPTEALPADLTAGPAARVQVRRGQSQRVDIPLTALGEARGWVYVDRDANGRRDPGEGIGGAVLILDGRATSSAADGSFGFFNLPPGTHEIRIETGRLSGGLEALMPSRMELGLPPGRSVDHLEFRLREKKKPVVFQEVRK